MACEIDADRAIEAARKFPGLGGMDLAKEVSTRAAYPWRDGQLDLDSGRFATAEPKYRVVAYAYGVTRNILRMLAARGCDNTEVPAQTPSAETLAPNAGGHFPAKAPGPHQPRH